MQPLIQTLTTEALGLLEEYLLSAVELLRKEQVKRHMRHAIDASSGIRYVRIMSEAAGRALDAMHKGLTYDNAIEIIMKCEVLPSYASADCYLILAIKQEQKRKRVERNALIAQLTRAGLSNREIAHRANVSITTVAKIAAGAVKDKVRPT